MRPGAAKDSVSQQATTTATALQPTPRAAKLSTDYLREVRIGSPRHRLRHLDAAAFVTLARLDGRDRLLRTLRVRNEHRPGVLGRLASAIGTAGANIGDIRTVWVGPEHIERDLDILLEDALRARGRAPGRTRHADVELLDVIDDVHEFHIDGKLEIRATHPVQSIHDLRRVYTPGVAEVVHTIAANPDESYIFTTRGKSVAIVTNGTRVLGLGNVGPDRLAAGDGGQGRPAPPVHRHLGLADRAGRARRRRDRRDREALRGRLRRDPARGHRVAGLLPRRGAAGRPSSRCRCCTTTSTAPRWRRSPPSRTPWRARGSTSPRRGSACSGSAPRAPPSRACSRARASARCSASTRTPRRRRGCGSAAARWSRARPSCCARATS